MVNAAAIVDLGSNDTKPTHVPSSLPPSTAADVEDFPDAASAEPSDSAPLLGGAIPSIPSGASHSEKISMVVRSIQVFRLVIAFWNLFVLACMVIFFSS
eukprot:ANDGO_06494.mRNA.1 hypothetical protein